MVWRGVIIEESLDDRDLLHLVNILKSKKTSLEQEQKILTFYDIELDENKKDEFVDEAEKSIKEGLYIHICKGNRMIVIFKDRFFEFTEQEKKKLDKAREYGLSIGILREQMPFEELIDDPYA